MEKRHARDRTVQNTDTYLWPLDGLRGLAALLIVIVHYTTAPWSFDPPVIPLPFPKPLHELTSFVYSGLFGLVGVVFFFELSGFIFMRNYRRPIAEGSVRLPGFCAARFSRLYPLGWLTSLAMLGIAVLETAYTPSLGGIGIYNPYDLMKSFALWGTYILDAGSALLNGVTWTLSMEITMYMLFFYLTTRSSRAEYPIVYYVLPIPAGILICNLNRADLPVLNQYVGLSLISFFSGCLLYEIYHTAILPRRLSGYISAVCILLFAASWFVPMTDQCGIDFYNKTFTSSVCTWALLVVPMTIIAALSIGPLYKLLSAAIFRWLGRISYSVYLIHFVVLRFISLLHSSAVISFNASDPMNLLLTIGVTLILSHFTYYFFEQPVQKVIRRKYKAYLEVREQYPGKDIQNT